MSTRSTIAVEYQDGSVDQVYCHFDGYLEGVGKTLLEHYTNPIKVMSLMNLGDISILGKEIGQKHSFDDYMDGVVCTFYRRDRGDSGCYAMKFGSLDDYEAHRAYEEFDYLMTKDGVWNVFYNEDWQDLEYIMGEKQ
jgi:hypothetical protein